MKIKGLPIFLFVIAFLFLNSLKFTFIEHFIGYETFNIDFKSIISAKFIFLLFLNSAIFLTAFYFKKRLFLIALYLLQTVYLFLHFSYFLYFNVPFHLRLFIVQFQEGLEMLRNFAIPGNFKYFIVFLDALLFMPVLLNKSKISSLVNTNNKILKLGVILFFSSTVILFQSFSRNNKAIEESKSKFDGEIEIIKKYGLFMHDVLDLLLYKDEKLLIQELNYGKPLIFENNAKHQLKNIICIQVESLDASVTDLKYKDDYIAPFLHELSNECVYYPFMYYGNPGTWRLEFEVINGVFPKNYFPVFKLRNYDYPNSLVKSLLNSGFSSAAFHNNKGSFYNRDAAFLKMGFQEFYDFNKMHLKENGWGAPDHDVFNYARNKLKEQKHPFFYYIITMSSHEPFHLVGNYYRNNLYDGIRDKITKNYFNSISYVDKVLKDFILFVRNEIRDTYIIIYGDHYAYSYDNYLNKKITFTLFRRFPFVPLFIITPDNQKHTENNKIASVLDLSPTILYASGISFNIMSNGVNLLDFPIQEDYIISRDGQTRSRKYIFKILKNMGGPDIAGYKK